MSKRDDLVRAIQKAATLGEQMDLVGQLEVMDRGMRRQAARTEQVDLAAAVVKERLTPVAVHERSTTATDWLGTVEAATEGAEHKIVAQATMWYKRTGSEVRRDAEEFAEQARNMGHRLASAYGDRAAELVDTFVTYAHYLNRREAASGLDQVQQLVDSQENPKQTPLPQEVFDNFAPPVDPINEGVTGTETSERAPLLQEIQSNGGEGGGPEKPGGHSTSEDTSGSYSEVEPEDPMSRRSVAINHIATLDDFRGADPKARTTSGSKQAASQVPQVQQAINVHDEPDPTPMPTDVAFPWTMTQDEYEGDHPNQQAFAARRRLVAVLMAKDPAQLTAAEHQEILSYAASLRVRAAGSDPTHWVEHNEFGGIAHSVPHGQVQKLLADPASANGWKIEREGEVVHATGPEGTYHTYHAYPRASERKHAARKTADQFTAPHLVPGGQVANSPATTPEGTGGSRLDGINEGKGDALMGEAPTYADASSAVPPFVQGHAQGYSDGMAQLRDQLAKDLPYGEGGLGGQSPGSDAQTNPNADPQGKAYASKTAGIRRISQLVAKVEAHENQDFRKGLNFARKWTPARPLVTQGNADFESGLYAGISDNPAHQAAWIERHRSASKRDPRYAERIDLHARFSKAASQQIEGVELVGPYMRLQAGTSTDLSTTGPGTSASPTGATPINGPGTVPPLFNQPDPAAAGGPSPYNGAEPFGKPVVPAGPAQTMGTPPVVDDTLGGPLDQAALDKVRSFRQAAKAGLARLTEKATA